MQKTLKRLGLILVALMLCFVMAFSLAACGDRGDEGNNGNSGNTGNTGDDGKDEKIPVTGVTLSEETVSIDVGESYTLSATVSPADASNKRVSWTSSDEEVATVASGLVTGLKAGTTTITAKTSDGGFTDTCTVTVSNIAVQAISMTPVTATVTAGGQQKLTVTVVPEKVSPSSLEWTSSDPEVAIVDKDTGWVTTLKAGTATITVASPADNRSASCTLTVTENTIDTSSYIQVDSTEDWLNIANNLAGNYILTADIDFKNVEVPTLGYAPGSGSITPFTGTIDGNGFAVMNAHFVSGGGNNDDCALIGEIGDAGTVRNLSVINCSAEGDTRAALLAAWNNGLIENCYVQGYVNSINSYWDPYTMGGTIVAVNEGTGTVRNCVAWPLHDGGSTFGLIGFNCAINDDGSPSVYNNFVVKDETLTDWALTTDIDASGSDGGGWTVPCQPMDNCAYVEVEDATSAASYPSLNINYWVIEDGKVPYVKTSVEGGRNWQRPEVGEVVIIPEISINQPAVGTSIPLTNGGVQLSYTLSPDAAVELDPEIVWTSNAEAVATVDENGFVAFKTEGQVTITVTVTIGEQTDTASITLTITA